MYKRQVQGNNHNVSKLIDKYTTLAKEALSSGDKILSENYFQHADHFSRIQSDKKEQNNLPDSSNNIPTKQEINSDK